jgi:hypothetical protein
VVHGTAIPNHSNTNEEYQHMTTYIYYVYAYLRKDGTPYYIGKGRGRRLYNNNHSITVPKDKSRIIFLETSLSEIGALSLERRYIRWYGRKDNNTGILRNLTDGGEGTSGIIGYWKGKNLSDAHKRNLSLSASGKKHLPTTEETKIKISKKLKGRKLSESHKKNLMGRVGPNKGKALSVETKRKLSFYMKSRGISPTPQNIKKIVEKNSKTWEIRYPTKNDKITVKNLKKFCRDNNINYSKIRKRKSSKRLIMLNIL